MTTTARTALPPPAVFFNEMCGKDAKENRINLALFAMLSNDQFKTDWLTSIGFATSRADDFAVYPPANTSGLRPDFVIVRETVVGWAEVERGPEDARQLAAYRSELGHVISIVGKRDLGGDQSLEHIVDIARNVTTWTRQGMKHREIFESLVASSTHGRIRLPRIAPAATTPLLLRMEAELGGIVRRGDDKARPNEILVITRASNNLSFRIFGNPEVQMLQQSIGTGEIRVPAQARLERCLRSAPVVRAYAEFLAGLGADISALTEGQNLAIPEQRLLDRFDDFSVLAVDLARAYSRI